MVPPSSHRVPRVRRYSGSCSLNFTSITRLSLSSVCLPMQFFSFHRMLNAVPTPEMLPLPVWPLPISLATTFGISVDFFSSPYLDVSVQAVPLIYLFYSVYDAEVLLQRIAPFGYPRIDVYLRLPVAFRSSLRPSSAPSAKAFPLRSL